MNPLSQLKIELYRFTLGFARLIMTGAQRVESKMVHYKTSLIAKIHGEQSTYGW